MSKPVGALNRGTLEFAQAWEIESKRTGFELIPRLLRYCRSRDPDVARWAITLAMNYRYSKPATQVVIDAPAQMALAWDTDADDAVLALAATDAPDDDSNATRH